MVKPPESVYTRTMNTTTKHKIARILLDAAVAAEAAYVEDVRAWYAEGDGRSVSLGGRGYQYPYCRHGVSTWVDYDCACGACEFEGNHFDWYQASRECIAEAERRERECSKRLARLREADLMADITVPATVRNGLLDWALEPVKV